MGRRVLAAVVSLCFGFSLFAPVASAAPTAWVRAESSSAAGHRSPDRAITADERGRPDHTQKRWHCERGGVGYGNYHCERFVSYDYCGGSRAITVSQFTKMTLVIYVRFAKDGGAIVADDYPATSRPTKRTFYAGQIGGWYDVATDHKPNRRPVLYCTLGR